MKSECESENESESENGVRAGSDTAPENRTQTSQYQTSFAANFKGWQRSDIGLLSLSLFIRGSFLQ
jgi:hypothetical protein